MQTGIFLADAPVQTGGAKSSAPKKSVQYHGFFLTVFLAGIFPDGRLVHTTDRPHQLTI